MYYTFGIGRSRIYQNELDDAVNCAVVVHLRQGLDTKFITVYECLTDRIRYQYCQACDRATEWLWETRLPKTSGRSKIGAACVRCGSQVALQEISLDGNGDVFEQLAFLFELTTNLAFQPSNVSQDLQYLRNWEKMTLQDLGMHYVNQLRIKDVRVSSTKMANTIEQHKVLRRKVKDWINQNRGEEMRARLMDGNAISGEPT